MFIIVIIALAAILGACQLLGLTSGASVVRDVAIFGGWGVVSAWVLRMWVTPKRRELEQLLEPLGSGYRAARRQEEEQRQEMSLFRTLGGFFAATGDLVLAPIGIVASIIGSVDTGPKQSDAYRQALTDVRSQIAWLKFRYSLSLLAVAMVGLTAWWFARQGLFPFSSLNEFSQAVRNSSYQSVEAVRGLFH